MCFVELSNSTTILDILISISINQCCLIFDSHLIQIVVIGLWNLNSVHESFLTEKLFHVVVKDDLLRPGGLPTACGSLELTRK